jgi:hypothetical protein
MKDLVEGKVAPHPPVGSLGKHLHQDNVHSFRQQVQPGRT